MLHDPRHPYTVGLLRCIPRGGVRKDHGRLDTIPGYLPADRRRPAGLRVLRPLRARQGRVSHRASRRSSPVGSGHVSRCFFHEQRAGAAARHGGRPRGRGPGRPARRAARRHRRPDEDLHPGRRHRATRSAASRPRSGRRDARPRGRVRLRQDDVRAHAARHRRGHGGLGRARRPRRSSRRSRSARHEDVRALQIVFQNPDSALNRRHTVRRILRRSLKQPRGITGTAADERIRTLSEAVRLPNRAVLQRPRSSRAARSSASRSRARSRASRA